MAFSTFGTIYRKLLGLGGRAERHGSDDLDAAPSSDRTAELLRQVLGPNGSLVAVDVGGANDLQPHWHRLNQVARFVVYEPHDASFQDLLRVQQEDPARYRDYLYLNQALSGEGGPRTLYLTNVPTGSSLLKPRDGSLFDYPLDTYLRPYKTETIATTTLAASLDGAQIPRIDLIKLDTQGSEYEILTGLDDSRFASLLAVETEVALLDAHEGTETELEDMLQLMRRKGFVIFDFRTNRFLGNAIRRDRQEITSVLGDELTLPPVAHRLNEVDAIFMRDPRHLLDNGADPATLRRLLAILLTYQFLPEAIFLIREAADRGVFDVAETNRLIGAVRQLKTIFAFDTRAVAEDIRRAGGQRWAQYMWVPHPSA